MGDQWLQPLSAHTKRITDWMRYRAGDAGDPGSYLSGWHDALMEIATEIEHNEIERCGHAE